MQCSSDGRYATHRENCKHTNNTSDGRYATHRDNCKQYLEYQKLFEPVECLSLNPANPPMSMPLTIINKRVTTD